MASRFATALAAGLAARLAVELEARCAEQLARGLAGLLARGLAGELAGRLASDLARALAAEPPEIALQYESPKVRLLVTFCRELQREVGDEPFFLSARGAAGICEVTPAWAAQWLRGLVEDGVLELVAKGDFGKHKASEFRYLGD